MSDKPETTIEEEIDDSQTIEVVTDEDAPKEEVVEAKPAEEEAEPQKYGDLDDGEKVVYSKGVQKRIDKLTREKHDATRRADAADRTRNDAINVARFHVEETQRQALIISEGQKFVVEQMKGKAGHHIELAQIQSAKALEEGDNAGVIKAQRDMIQAENEWKTATDYEASFATREQPQQQQEQWQQQQQQPQSPQQQWQQPAPPPPPTQAGTDWAKENTWFQSPEHHDMTSLAFGIHRNLIQRGMQPDSAEYFEELNSEMRLRFPEEFEDSKGSPERETPPANVVAPSRRTGRGTPRKVRLTASQIALAKQLGLTKVEMAEGVEEERQRGK